METPCRLGSARPCPLATPTSTSRHRSRIFNGRKLRSELHMQCGRYVIPVSERRSSGAYRLFAEIRRVTYVWCRCRLQSAFSFELVTSRSARVLMSGDRAIYVAAHSYRTLVPVQTGNTTPSNVLWLILLCCFENSTVTALYQKSTFMLALYVTCSVCWYCSRLIYTLNNLHNKDCIESPFSGFRIQDYAYS